MNWIYIVTWAYLSLYRIVSFSDIPVGDWGAIYGGMSILV